MGCAASKTAAQSAVDVLPPAGQSAAVTAAPTDRRVPPTLAQPTSTQPTSTSPLSLARRPLAEAVQAATPPPQTISIGANVPRTDKPTVVFLFGDPGSGKGQLIDLLAGEFDFRLVALEQLLMQRARLLSADSTATDDAAPVTRQSKMRRYSILGALKTIGSHDELNMGAALQLVKTAIEEAREQTDARHFVVDVIPNHRLVLNESPLLRNAAQTLIRFERLDIKGHLDMSSFGLWLCAPADKPQTTLMPRSSKGQSPGDEPAPAKRLKGSLLLRSSIAPFVSAFESGQRLVKMEVGGLPALRDFLAGCGLHPYRSHSAFLLSLSTNDAVAGLAAHLGRPVNPLSAGIDIAALSSDPAVALRTIAQALRSEAGRAGAGGVAAVNLEPLLPLLLQAAAEDSTQRRLFMYDDPSALHILGHELLPAHAGVSVLHPCSEATVVLAADCAASQLAAIHPLLHALADCCL